MTWNGMNNLFDYLFYNCYIWARANDEDGKQSMACHTMSFVLVSICCSLVSLATLIMPIKFVVVLGIVFGLLELFIYYELQCRYEDKKLRKAIVSRYKPTTRIKSLVVFYFYMMVSLSPAIIIIVVRKYL